ncbi:MAG TPA: amino acid permease [Pyrinomonadaceae bacterium]|jgi:APA family basic amino acid/polyamine antiporter|nr:amino acid permease [Pyrinomonadaceae bacterium]
MTKLAPENVTLVRGLGLTAATSVNIANMIGTGVFLKTRVMTCNVGTPGMVITVWIVAGLLALAGALTYAELTTMMPRAGGEYVFMREAYGRRWGFLFGWTQFFIARTGSQAALAVGFAIFLNILTGGALSGAYFTLRPFGFAIPFGHLQLVALATIAVTTLINCGAVSLSGKVSSALTFVKIALVLSVGVGAFLFATGDWGHFAQSDAGGACEGVSAAARGGVAGFGAAMLGALWAYDGWNNVAPLAGEVRDPQRNLPRAFVLGMLVVGALYIFVNLAYYYVLTPTEIAGVSAASSVATEVASRFMGATAITLIAAALMTSSFGALHTSVLASARYPYAMSRDRLFFQSLARLSPKTHVPVRALIAQGLWSGVLALSGSYDTLTDYAIFALWIFYGLTTASVFIFRRKMPDAERPYRTPGYPVIPVIFLIVTAWLLVNTLQTAPKQAFTGLGLIALGLPVYWYWARHNERHEIDSPAIDET